LYVINRGVAVIKPSYPFLAWLQSIEDDANHEITMLEIRDDSSVYLLPDCDSPEDHLKAIQDIYLDIFEAELEAWCADRRLWPKGRDYQAFQEWFDIEIHSCVFDTCVKAIIREQT
jgi:hypothetical protein